MHLTMQTYFFFFLNFNQYSIALVIATDNTNEKCISLQFQWVFLVLLLIHIKPKMATNQEKLFLS